MYPVPCKDCNEHRKLDSNGTCKKCNAAKGLRQCGTCKDTMLVELFFYPSQGICKECIRQRGRA